MRVQIDQVATDTTSGQPLWIVDGVQHHDDGTSIRLRHVFPLDTLEWRAAEYGIDPADTATLLDIVLAEPYLTKEDWAAGHQLHDAPDIATARRDHLERCAAAKWRHRISSRTKTGPCRRILDESPMHPEAIELKQQLVAQARAARAAARVAKPQDRIGVLRAAVERHGRGVGE